MNIVIAGGTGLIGQNLTKSLISCGYRVKILSRSGGKSNEELVTYHKWDPYQDDIDEEVFKDIDVLINLSGAGIADKRWTSTRKKELIDSRVIPAQFLLNKIKEKEIVLKQYISASGINCYGWEDREKIRTEDDAYGDDFLSSVVKKWESTALEFKEVCPVTLIRTSVVLSKSGGALEPLKKVVKRRMGSALGSGNQYMPWIHIDDLTRFFLFCIEKKVDGVYNVVADGNTTNKELMRSLNEVMGKKTFLPAVPGFVLKLYLGKMAEMLLNGVKVSNQKIKEKGFEFNHVNLKEVFTDLL